VIGVSLKLFADDVKVLHWNWRYTCHVDWLQCALDSLVERSEMATAHFCQQMLCFEYCQRLFFINVNILPTVKTCHDLGILISW